MGALTQPTPGGPALDPAAELRAALSARVKLEELWQKFQTDSTAAQDQALTTIVSAQTFVDFSTQMDKIIQADTDFQSAHAKKDAEATWLNEHGVVLIKANHKIAEAVEKELGKSNQLKWLEYWEKAAKAKPASAAPAKAAKSTRRRTPKTP